MRLNKESRKLTRQLFRSSFTNGKLDSAKASSVVNSLVQSRPRHYIDILKAFQRLARLEIEKSHAIIESVAPLAPDASSKIVNDLKARHGKELTTEFKVSPELLGGLRIKIGNDVWDGSVRHRLDRLTQQFNEV